MRHGSLFSGIGGFDLASEWMGWENVFHCEWNEFGQKVLKYYWPKSITYNDITKTDFTIHRGTIDILTGGFPCQPYSSAGKRLGKEDERHLWPEMLRTIREIQPSWVVGENVRGLTNWNGGLVFDEVQADLEAEGYEVTPFLLPACAVNAPHRRDRIWFVAYSASASKGAKELRQIRRENAEIDREGSQTIHDAIRPNGFEGFTSDSKLKRFQGCTDTGEVSSEEGTLGGEGNKFTTQFASINKESNATNSNGFGLRRQSHRIGNSRFTHKNSKGNNWKNFPTVSPVCDGDDGISDRLDGITFSKWRNESIKAGGNAIVPQVVYQIFKAIEQYNQLNNQLTL
jgi:DNA (cytosine-5)-methyltransferase 1